MTSENPVIALRLDQVTFDKIRELAAKDGRSMSNFVDRQLKRLLYPNLEPVFPASYYEPPVKGKQMHIEDAIAAAVKAGPVTTSAKQAAHRKNMAARAARFAARTAKHK